MYLVLCIRKTIEAFSLLSQTTVELFLVVNIKNYPTVNRKTLFFLFTLAYIFHGLHQNAKPAVGRVYLYYIDVSISFQAKLDQPDICGSETSLKVFDVVIWSTRSRVMGKWKSSTVRMIVRQPT